MASLPESVRTFKFDKNIWSLVISSESKLILDIRNDDGEDVNISSLNVDTGEINYINIHSMDKWFTLVGSEESQLYFVKYPNRKDPTRVEFLLYDNKDALLKNLERLPHIEEIGTYPQVYEHNSEYHKTVSKFLGLELPLSCEYLEWSEKIIISYYLRSGNEFDRYLLLLAEGKKVWKIKQDCLMRGFSTGSFFVLKNQLIFIKDRNEVCIYTD